MKELSKLGYDPKTCKKLAKRAAAAWMESQEYIIYAKYPFANNQDVLFSSLTKVPIHTPAPAQKAPKVTAKPKKSKTTKK